MIKVRTMNEYQIDAMLKSDIDINYDNFYKEQLIDMLKVCRDKYKNELKAKNEAIEYIKELDDNTDDTTCYDIDRHTREDLLEILGGKDESK